MPNVHQKGLVFDVGVNDIKGLHGTPVYTHWKSMLMRCYSEKFKANHPAYKECSVCEEWKRLSVFKEWFDKNYQDDYDLEKDIDRRFPTDKVSESSVRETLKGFLGEQEQVAPLFSAKSVDGVRAYELSRKLYRKQRSASYEAEALHADPNNAENISDTPKQDASGSTEEQSQSVFDAHAADLIRTSRIRIDKLELLNFSPDGTSAHAPSMSPDYSGMNEQEIARAKEKDSRINIVDITPLHLPLAEVRINCTKRTYIRAFARDLGEALDSGAFLSYLIRSRSGDYPLSQALTMAQVSALFQD